MGAGNVRMWENIPLDWQPMTEEEGGRVEIKEVENLVGAKAGWTSLVCRESAGRRSRESPAGGELGLVEATTYPEQVYSLDARSGESQDLRGACRSQLAWADRGLGGCGRLRDLDRHVGRQGRRVASPRLRVLLATRCPTSNSTTYIQMFSISLSPARPVSPPTSLACAHSPHIGA